MQISSVSLLLDVRQSLLRNILEKVPRSYWKVKSETTITPEKMGTWYIPIRSLRIPLSLQRARMLSQTMDLAATWELRHRIQTLETVL